MLHSRHHWLMALALLVPAAAGQDLRRGSGRRDPVRSSYPMWDVGTEFREDVFTFVRIQFDSIGRSRGGGGWRNDFPDCDWNFSYRLQQLTSLRVHPDGLVLRLTDPRLTDHPFLYMSNVNQMALSDAECAALRHYLLNGGFLMADDFWAPQAWRHVERQMKRVFPDRQATELSWDHPIFHLVYDITCKPQVPSIRAWIRGDTFEYWHGDPEGDEDPHFWAYHDDDGRIVALLCHNNDIGDGWEREGDNEEYFRTYSEKVSYPLGINIVTYAMTH